MVSELDAINIYKCLSTNGFQVWLNGGWGIDALLGEQTRPHKDLDMFVSLDDISRMCEVLAHEGYSLKEIWSENRWTIDGQGNQIATAFVLHDPDGREIDVHAIRLDVDGNAIPEWEENTGFILTAQNLAGVGMIAGFMVQCITAEKQMLCHTGYELPEKQVPELRRLHEKFGLEYPQELSQRLGSTGT
jgi:lincosamide nucleotidyltransferase A/C/D/E